MSIEAQLAQIRSDWMEGETMPSRGAEQVIGQLVNALEAVLSRLEYPIAHAPEPDEENSDPEYNYQTGQADLATDLKRAALFHFTKGLDDEH